MNEPMVSLIAAMDSFGWTRDANGSFTVVRTSDTATVATFTDETTARHHCAERNMQAVLDTLDDLSSHGISDGPSYFRACIGADSATPLAGIGKHAGGNVHLIRETLEALRVAAASDNPLAGICAKAHDVITAQVFLKNVAMNREQEFLAQIRALTAENDRLRAGLKAEGFTYLAAPYSHPDKAVIEQRMEQVCKAAADLTMEGKLVVSPLMMHFVLQHRSIPGTWNFWGRYSAAMLARCTEMVVLMLPGWETSEGVTAELKLAEAAKLPVSYREP
jgi:hypothetical protein